MKGEREKERYIHLNAEFQRIARRDKIFLSDQCKEIEENNRMRKTRDLSSGEGNGKPLQYSCLENPMDGGAWWATVHGVPTSRLRLSDFTFTQWRSKWQPTPVFLPGESQGRWSLVGCCYGVAQSQTRLKRLSSSSSRDLFKKIKRYQGNISGQDGHNKGQKW